MRNQVWTARLRALLFVPLACSLVYAASGQETSIKGVVKDKTGQAMPGIKVVFTDADSGNRFTLKSDKEGKFLKYAIPTGEYRVTAQAEGYFPYKSTLTVIFGKDETLEVVLEKIPPKLDEDRDFQEGVSLFKEARYAEAVADFEKVAARFPDSAEAAYNLGVSELRAGKTDQAIATLERTVQLKPDLSEAYFALGECYFDKGDGDRAIKVFSKTLDLSGQNAKSYYNLGVVYDRLNRVDDAVASFEKSLELDPGFSSAYYQGGIAYVKKGDLKKAIQYLEQFLKQEPNAPESPRVKTMIAELKKQIER